MTLTAKRQELVELNRAVAIGVARLKAATDAVDRAVREGLDSSALVAATARYAELLEGLIDRRNALMRKVNPNLN